MHVLQWGTTITKHCLYLLPYFSTFVCALRQTEPEYEAAAKMLKDDETIQLAKIDCVAEKELCKSYEVGSYPTLKIFRYVIFMFHLVTLIFSPQHPLEGDIIRASKEGKDYTQEQSSWKGDTFLHRVLACAFFYFSVRQSCTIIQLQI